MYCWRIERLKNRLREGPLSQRAAFRYIVATLLLYTLTTGMPLSWNSRSEGTTILDWLTYACSIVIVGVGTYAAYRVNGGAGGSDFASRYFALGWVLFLRLVLLLFLPAIALVMAAGMALGGNEAETTRSDDVFGWAGALVGIAFESVYFWRLAHHVRQVAGRV